MKSAGRTPKKPVQKDVLLNRLAPLKSLLLTVYKRGHNFLKNERDVYPVVIFALLPSLSFWSGSNVTELTLGLMLRSLIATILAGLALYTLIYFLAGRSRFKASLLTIVALVFTLSYRYLYMPYQDLVVGWFGEKTDAQLHHYFIFLLIIIFAGVTYLVRRKLTFSKTIRNYVAILASILLAFNLFPIIRQWIGTYDLKNIEFGKPVPNVDRHNPSNPDIYYLVFDRYANQQVLKDVYGYDNSPFLDSLKKKGFYIAEKSAANYPATSFSLASSLNLDYLPEELNERSENGLFTSILHNAIEDNRTVEYLKSQGYTFLNIGPWWNPTKYSQHADENLYNPAGVVVAGRPVDLQEHEMLLFQDTVFWQFSRRPLKVFGRTVLRRTYPSGDTAGRSIHGQTAIHQFEALKQVSIRPGPKFVFAHVLQPHDPYVFDEKCQKMPRSTEHEYKLYIKQIQCTNSQIQATIDHILRNSPSEPIILIQADEGPYPIEFRKNKELEWSKASTQLLHQKEKILSAYYFPDRNYKKLYPAISPVNSFRLIFDQYFEQKLPLLEDRHFFSESRSKRFHLFEVTDKFK